MQFCGEKKLSKWPLRVSFTEFYVRTFTRFLVPWFLFLDSVSDHGWNKIMFAYYSPTLTIKHHLKRNRSHTNKTAINCRTNILCKKKKTFHEPQYPYCIMNLSVQESCIPDSRSAQTPKKPKKNTSSIKTYIKHTLVQKYY